MVRISKDRLTALDEVVAAGHAESRRAALDAAVDAWIEHQRRQTLGRQIVDEYTRVPQQPSEISWVRAASEASIAAEPW
jgi:DNA-binding helix-hairpin-helix protein with protein kinase domain